MTKIPMWSVGIVWADGMSSGSEHLQFAAEPAAREAWGVLKAIVEMDADQRLSEKPVVITLCDDFGSQMQVFGRLIRIIRLQELQPSRESALATDAEFTERRAYAEALGRFNFNRDREAGKFEDAS